MHSRYSILKRPQELVSQLLDWLAIQLGSSSIIFSELLISLVTFAMGTFITWVAHTGRRPMTAIAPLFEGGSGAFYVGQFAMCLATFQIASVLGGAYRWRKLASFVEAISWVFLAVVVLSHSLYTIAVIFYPAIICAAAYSYLRLQAIDDVRKSLEAESNIDQGGA